MIHGIITKKNLPSNLKMSDRSLSDVKIALFYGTGRKHIDPKQYVFVICPRFKDMSLSNMFMVQCVFS